MKTVLHRLRHGTGMPEWFVRLEAKIEADTERIKSAQIIATALIEGRKMGKLQEVAQRIAQTKQDLEAEGDRLVSKLDNIGKKAPEAFARGHAILDQHHADLDAMETELKQLSNLPLEQDKSHGG